MIKPANDSSQHLKHLDRWIAQAKRENPALNEDQATRIAEQLRSDYFRGLANTRHHGDPKPKAAARRTDDAA